MDDNETKYVPIKDLKVEEGAEELLHSLLMRPYIEAAKAFLQNKDASKVIADIAALPLEKRYVWRIVSALKWGFADFDSGSVAIEMAQLVSTLPDDEDDVIDPWVN